MTRFTSLKTSALVSVTAAGRRGVRPAITRATRARAASPKSARRAGAALVLLTALTQTAHAAEFYVSGSIGYQAPHLHVIDQYEVTAPISVGRGVKHDDPGVKDFHAQANSLADNHGLHAHAYNQVIHQVSGSVPPSTDGGTYTSTAFARSSFGDFVITGPQGATTVQAAINFHMTGQQILSSFIPPAGHGGGGSTSSVNFSMYIGGIGGDGGWHTLAYERGLPLAPYEGGMLAGFDGDIEMKTMVFTLPVNTALPIALYLHVGSSVSVDFADAFNVGANTDFSGTLTFATDRPVFDLPLGYTVNSAEAGVVDNLFVAPLPVPEPATAWMLGVGLAGLWARRRRGRRDGVCTP